MAPTLKTTALKHKCLLDITKGSNTPLGLLTRVTLYIALGFVPSQ